MSLLTAAQARELSTTNRTHRPPLTTIIERIKSQAQLKDGQMYVEFKYGKGILPDDVITELITLGYTINFSEGLYLVSWKE